MLGALRHDLRWSAHNAHYGRGRLLMSDLRKLWVRVLHPNATIRFGHRTYLGPGFSLEIPHNGTFIAGDRVEFRRGFRAEVSGNGRIEIGAGTVCTYGVLMQCSTTMIIGARCVFAQAVSLVDGQHRFRDYTTPMLEQGYAFEPRTVGDDVFVGSKATIMGDLGERAVVAANAAVTSDVPPFTIVAGVPAQVIEYFGPPEKRPPGVPIRGGSEAG